MIFAILFVLAFIIGVITYATSNTWWLGGIAGTVILTGITLVNIDGVVLRGVALYFGIPIVWFGSLFGAYIVQLRRGDALENLNQNSESEDSE